MLVNDALKVHETFFLECCNLVRVIHGFLVFLLLQQRLFVVSVIIRAWPVAVFIFIIRINVTITGFIGVLSLLQARIHTVLALGLHLSAEVVFLRDHTVLIQSSSHSCLHLQLQN